MGTPWVGWCHKRRRGSLRQLGERQLRSLSLPSQALSSAPSNLSGRVGATGLSPSSARLLEHSFLFLSPSLPLEMGVAGGGGCTSPFLCAARSGDGWARWLLRPVLSGRRACVCRALGALVPSKAAVGQAVFTRFELAPLGCQPRKHPEASLSPALDDTQGYTQGNKERAARLAKNLSSPSLALLSGPQFRFRIALQ